MSEDNMMQEHEQHGQDHKCHCEECKCEGCICKNH